MRKILAIVLLVSFCFFSCSKKDTPSPEPGGGNGNGNAYGVPGALMFDWATDGILQVDLKTGKTSTVLPENTSRYGWDISRDGKFILQSTEAPTSVENYYDANVYTLTNMDDGANVFQFVYYPAEGDLTNGFLSPDESMVAVQPTFDDGIVILDTKGNILHNLTAFGGKKISYGTEIAWMPDETLLFTLGNGIYRTNQDFTQASLIKQFDFNSWGNIAVSMDGKKISLDGGNHIWMMNSDGSNLVQVTESDQVEKMSAFSPDGKYLLVGTDWHVTGPFGSIWYLAIIPADGEKYNVNEGTDKRVVFIKDTQEGGNQACDGYMYWRK